MNSSLFVLFAFVVSIFFQHCVAAEKRENERIDLPTIYQKIEDLHHPSNKDFRLIQEYLSSKERNVDFIQLPNRTGFDFTKDLFKKMKIIGSLPNELPESGKVSIPHQSIEKNNCIILYSTFNRNYPNALRRLVELIQRTDFSGDVLYRLGGWPNTEAGDLILAHVPYAFKACMFKEAENLGYKRVLWLDSSVVPVASMKQIFQLIEKWGYLVVKYPTQFSIGPYMNAKAAEAFGLTLQDTYHITSVAASIIGIDFTHRNGKALIDGWYQAAHDPYAFFSPRSDQNALSIVLYQLGLREFIPLTRVPQLDSGQVIRPDSLFAVDRKFAYGKELL